MQTTLQTGWATKRRLWLIAFGFVLAQLAGPAQALEPGTFDPAVELPADKTWHFAFEVIHPESVEYRFLTRGERPKEAAEHAARIERRWGEMAGLLAQAPFRPEVKVLLWHRFDSHELFMRGATHVRIFPEWFGDGDKVTWYFATRERMGMMFLFEDDLSQPLDHEAWSVALQHRFGGVRDPKPAN